MEFNFAEFISTLTWKMAVEMDSVLIVRGIVDVVGSGRSKHTGSIGGSRSEVQSTCQASGATQ